MNQSHAINIKKTCTYTPWEYVIDSGDIAGPNFWHFLEGVDVDGPGLYGGRAGEPPIPAAAGMVTRFLMVTNRWWTIPNVVHLHIHTHSRHIGVPPPSSVLGQLTPVAGWLLVMKKYERIWRHTLSHRSLTCPSQIIELAWETPQSHWCCWKQCHKQHLMWKCRHEYQGECCHLSQDRIRAWLSNRMGCMGILILPVGGMNVFAIRK